MSLAFDPLPHVYTLDGVVVPHSVTGLLRQVGLIDFSMIPHHILEAARTRGTTVHQAIHYFNEHDLDLEGFYLDFPGYAGYVQSWVRLMDTGRLVTVLCEHRLASRQPVYAGTLDWLGLFDGHAAILDFATGDPDDAAKHLQTAAYVLAAKKWMHEPGEEALRAFLTAHPFVARYSVRLHKTGSLPTVTPYRDPKDFTKFLQIAETVAMVLAERPKAMPWDWQSEAA